MAFRQYPVIQTSPQLGPGKFPGGYIWGVLFRLPVPAVADGFIVQEMDMTEEGTTSAGVTARNATHYWEAWPVRRGQSEITDASGRQTLAEFIRSQGGTPPPGAATAATFNDFFFRTFAQGNRGSRVVRAAAAFYDDPLPADFVIGNASTGAGALPSTTRRPRFWQDKGLFRFLRFTFDFTSGRDPANATLETMTQSVGTIAAGANPDPSMLRTW